MIKQYPATFTASIIALAITSHSSYAAPTYNVQGGFLTGINNIDINGTNYDVTFRDGVFEDLFSLADPFTFTTGIEASDASQALSLAMADVADGLFDTDPLLTYGCAADNCQIRTPFEFGFGFVSAEWFRNAALEVDDERGSIDFLPGYDSTGNAVVFADWSPTTPVPLPPSLLLFGFGLAGLSLVGKKQTP